MRTVSLAVAIIVTVGPAIAQDAFEYKTVDCAFTENFVTTLEGPALAQNNVPEKFNLSFSGFEAKKGKALVIGNAGAEPVLYIPSSEKALLLEITASGNGALTSISTPKNGRSIAFHTRHMWIVGSPVISHYHTGTCHTRR